MTLDEIRVSDKPFLTPADVAGVLAADAQSIRLQAREFPEALGFPVIVAGRRVKIPKRPFIRFMREGN